MEKKGKEGEKGILWELPVLRSKHIGSKIGPAFALGAGCGFGFGFGLLGGAGIGGGIPGLQFGFGVGVGCGVGFGFGYGVGRGVAHDHLRRYSNVSNSNFFSQDEMDAFIHHLLDNTNKFVRATSTQIRKWRP